MAALRRKLITSTVVSLLPTIMAELDEEDEVQEEVTQALVDDKSTNCEIAVVSALCSGKKETPATVEGFVDVTVPSYSLDAFHGHFRMSRHTFEVRLKLTGICMFDCACCEL